MNTTAKRRLLLGWSATLLAAALPLGAAHAVESVAAVAIPVTGGGAPALAVVDRASAECPPPAGEDAAAKEADTPPETGKSAGGGAVGLEQTPRWKTLIPGALR